jgi:rhodanese-related sulfurtransferase
MRGMNPEDYSGTRSERQRCPISVNAAWICACIIVVSVPGVPRANGSPPGRPESPPTRKVPGAYCGVQSLYRALRALGKEVRFADLVRPEYITSKEGSTIADLTRAANAFGAYAKPMGRMPSTMLRQAKGPVLLHVKSDLRSNDYNHWVLFMGTERGTAKIYDRDQPATEVKMDALSARWDGVALLMSDSPVDTAGIWLGVFCPFLLYAGIAAFVLGILSLMERYGARMKGKGAWANVTSGRLGQATGLLLIAACAASAYRGLSDGALSSAPAIAAIQESHFGSFLPKVTTGSMAALLEIPAVAIVDARLPSDFEAGHLKGAISVPVNASREACEKAMGGVPKEYRVVVYSHSNGCPFGENVAKMLLSLGYHKLALYKGGWIEWEKHARTL